MNSNLEMQTDDIKVLIADDHRLISEAVANLLTNTPDFSAAIVDTYDQAVKALQQDGPFRVVMLDLKMPGMVGLESVKQVVRAAGDAKVILFTGNVDRHFLSSALELGAKGLIPKTMPLKSLVSVIRLVDSGQVFIPMDGSSSSPSGSQQEHNLTDREMFVLRLAADGLTNKEIAREMDATEATVKMYMRGICTKLGARNRAHAAIISRELSMF